MTTEQNRTEENAGAIRIIMPNGVEYRADRALIIGLGVESDDPDFIASNEAEAKARAERDPQEPCANCGEVHELGDPENVIQILHGAMSISEVGHLRAAAMEVTDQALTQGLDQLMSNPMAGALFAALHMARGASPIHGMDIEEIFRSTR